MWTQPAPYDPSPEFRSKFISYASCGMAHGNVDAPQEGSSMFKFFYFLSGELDSWIVGRLDDARLTLSQRTSLSFSFFLVIGGLF